MLTNIRIKNAKPKKKSYRMADSQGLCLEIRPTGAKLWRYRYRIAGKENVFALGEYPSVSLVEAREERDKARKLVKEGIHPSHKRKAERIARIYEDRDTFQALAKEWIEQRRAHWSPVYFGQVDNFLATDVFPHIGALPIKSVTSAHLLEIIKRVEKRAPTVALLIRQWCSAIFRYGVATLRADSDPTFALKGALTRPPVEHRKALSQAEIPELIKGTSKNSTIGR